MDDPTLDDATSSDGSGAAARTSTSDDRSSSTVTGKLHDWASSFTGVATRAKSDGGSTSTSAGSDGGSGGGFFRGVANAVSDAASGGVSAISEAASNVVEAVAPASPPAATDDHDNNAGGSSDAVDSLGSMASGVGGALRAAASTVLNAGAGAQQAVSSAKSAAWNGAKSAYGAAASAYDSLAPAPTKSNQDLGKLVDAAEAAVKKGNDEAVAKTGDVPILGSLMKASAVAEDGMADVAGGLVKGVGDLAAMGENAFVHPIDAAVSMAEGALEVVEHVPSIPGVSTTTKAFHGLVDLGLGKKDGEYGASLTDLGENLLVDTQQDPNDPSKRTNTDVDFFASMGGGTKAWTDNPLEAATRTIVDVAPMVLGDEGAGGTKRGPGGPPNPEGPPAAPAGDPSAQPPRGSPLATTGPGPTPESPSPGVDPANPRPESDPRNAPPEATIDQLEQNLADAKAAEKLAQEASNATMQTEFDAVGEWMRYHQGMPDPSRGFAGDPSWDPKVEKELWDKQARAEEANGRNFANSKAATQAVELAEKALRVAKDEARWGKGGVSGS